MKRNKTIYNDDRDVFGSPEFIKMTQQKWFSLFFISFIDPPKFKPPPSSTAVGVEGESLVVAMVADGNPNSIQYTWTKDSLPITAKNGKFILKFAYLQKI